MNFFLFHLDYYYLILVVPAMILALIAQIGGETRLCKICTGARDERHDRGGRGDERAAPLRPNGCAH